MCDPALSSSTHVLLGFIGFVRLNRLLNNQGVSKQLTDALDRLIIRKYVVHVNASADVVWSCFDVGWQF